jgi:hypothetical protein
MKKTLPVFLVTLFTNGLICFASTNLPANNNHDPNDTSGVKVYLINEEVPSGAVKIGEMNYGGDMFSEHCTYEDNLYQAKEEAKKEGGNAIKIIKSSKSASLANSCHKLTVLFLKINEIVSIDTLTKSQPKYDYAILYVYRPTAYGFLIEYKLNLGDTVLCKVKAKSCFRFIIKTMGVDTLWAKTEDKAILPINIEPGKEYFLNCGLSYGLFVGRPALELVDNSVGFEDYFALKGFNDIIYRKNGDKVKAEIIYQDDNVVYFYTSINGKTVKTQIEKSDIDKVEMGK